VVNHSAPRVATRSVEPCGDHHMLHSMTACSGVAQMLSTTQRACSMPVTLRQ
jgi:hypothetical protein